MEGQGAPNGGGGGGGGMGGGVPGGGIAAPSSKSPSRSTGGNGPSITFDGNVVVVNGGGPSTFVQQQQGGGGGGGSTTPVPTANGNSEVEEENNKPEQWQLDLLMEKLRQKSSMLKPLVDTSKNIRQALMVIAQINQLKDKIKDIVLKRLIFAPCRKGDVFLINRTNKVFRNLWMRFSSQLKSIPYKVWLSA